MINWQLQIRATYREVNICVVKADFPTESLTLLVPQKSSYQCFFKSKRIVDRLSLRHLKRRKVSSDQSAMISMSPTSPFAILQPQYLWIGELYVVQDRRSTDFKASKF